MADLKQDLFNHVKTKKFYAEMELARLAADPNIVYEEKIYNISNKLQDIVLLNSQIEQIDFYFRQPETEQVPPSQETIKKQGNKQGFSHNE